MSKSNLSQNYWAHFRTNGRIAAVVVILMLLALPGFASSPTDLVPRGSGLYDAMAILAQKGLLAQDSPDATQLLGFTGRLYTRAEFAAMITDINDETNDPQTDAALDFARNILAPELDMQTGSGIPGKSTLGYGGFSALSTRGQTDTGHGLGLSGNGLGRTRLFGGLGRDGAYTIDVTNVYRQTRDHASFTTADNGKAGGDHPNVLNGLDEAYVTVVGNHGFRFTLGKLRERWGSGYRGDLIVSDNAPSQPTVEIEFPFSLGNTLGSYTYTQNESTYQNLGATIYRGSRRVEHPIGDRVDFGVEETYVANRFNNPGVLVLPYYAYRLISIPNSQEPTQFNYLLGADMTVRPDGPDGTSRIYGQIVIDDLKAPKAIGKSGNIPRKLGFLVGFAKQFPDSGSDLVVEFARTDRATYTKDEEAGNQKAQELSWFDSGLPETHPIGPNGQELYVRIGHRLSDNLDLAIEARDRERVTDNFPAPTEQALDVNFNYHLSASQSIGLWLSAYRENPFTGTSTITPSNTLGAAYGERLRRNLIAVSFLQAF